MAQDMFNFAMDTARECIGKFKKEESLAWLSMLLTSSMKNMGSTGCQLSVTTLESMYVIKEFCPFPNGRQRFCDLQSCIDKRELTFLRLVKLFILFEYFLL